MATQPPFEHSQFITATPTRFHEAVEGLLNRRLTDDERLSLNTRLAGIKTHGVAPGDLITADLFNALRADLNDLAIRLALLERGTTVTPIYPVLTATDPPKGVHVGSVLTLVGSGFVPSNRAEATIVSLGNIRIDQFHTPLTAGTVSFIVPSSFPELPRDVQVIVEVGNRKSNALSLKLLAPLQSGKVLVSLIQSPSSPVYMHSTVQYTWQVDNQTKQDVSLSFGFDISTPSESFPGTNSWKPTINPQTATLPAGSKKTIITSAVVPTGVKSATVTFEISKTDPSDPVTIEPSTLSKLLKINTKSDIPPIVEKEWIEIDRTHKPSNNVISTITNNNQPMLGVQVPRGQSTTIQMILKTPDQSDVDSYIIQPEFLGESEGWSVKVEPEQISRAKPEPIQVTITTPEGLGSETTRMLQLRVASSDGVVIKDCWYPVQAASISNIGVSTKPKGGPGTGLPHG
ncbi:MAG: hypothetical protein ACK46L_06200 [Synechococcaceae cyanobacterium]|jgi:hypothetical protein